MSKRLLFAGALAAFATISGLPSLITNLIISKGPHSVVHAWSNSLEKRQNQPALKNPTADAARNVNSLIFQTAFVTLKAGALKAPMDRHDNFVAPPYNVLLAKEDVDLGEIFIDDAK